MLTTNQKKRVTRDLLDYVDHLFHSMRTLTHHETMHLSNLYARKKRALVYELVFLLQAMGILPMPKFTTFPVEPRKSPSTTN